ncbi:BREX system P-loop protein BrxC [Iodidimonas sp. SYSU 1G8]|uniref:BREX system P-loop protein BrxC n=1 Tax=Iodidimonas sp. SYSU 1G8 TaxID=3133967 RepID=UPI0031FE9DFB
MTQIRSLFDPQRGIERSIEKVISYQASQEERLKAEISEYIVTDSIDQQLERLLENIQAALDSDGSHEVGVWVSGFYGSGKSSFTKYLGLALDQRVIVDGQPFLRHLYDRLRRPQTKALLNAVASRLSAAVILLDLASQQIAGATLAEVSTVLYHKVLQQLGYSRNLKVAALERKLKRDGRYEEFVKLFADQTGEIWTDYHNDELVVDSLLPALAYEMYPLLFQSDQAFSAATSDMIYLMNDRVQEMIDVIREETGKDHVVFVIDEIGEYVGGDTRKIHDLQGLAENIKNIGHGKVWMFGTAQQTLTEDDPRMAINSPLLFKLKDRFPISVELESSDIKEICYRRLLGKSAAGEAELGGLFDRHGQALRHNTKLADAKFYDAGFDRQAFINLYPFLPAHFEILLRLLGALAKSTGGIGLRSAIKVIQDVLVEPSVYQPPVADRPTGWLATTVTLYDSLERDIRRAFPSLHTAVDKVIVQFPDNATVQAVAKTVVVLQILANIPATVENVAALMHPQVDTASVLDAVKSAVDAMIRNQFVPLGEKDGSLRFFSERLNDVEQERLQIPLRTTDVQRIFNTALAEVFDPPPSARIFGNLTVTTGLKRLVSGRPTTLTGERETVQTLIALSEPGEFDADRTKLVEESRQRLMSTTIYLLGSMPADAMDKATEIYRCARIVELHRNDPDQEVKEYCASQSDRAAKLHNELKLSLSRGLAKGAYIFRGTSTAVESLDPQLPLAAKKHIGDAASQIYDRYPEAGERVDTALPEKFLRAPNLRAITSQLDPLSLVRLDRGQPSIETKHKALVSIRDVVERNGVIEGKKLLEHFSDHPFGWSPDTTRYLVAALLLASEIKLKVGGREVTAVGQQAIEALKTNNAFKSIGVSLRHDRPSMDVLLRAAERLRDLSGDDVLPLEEEISKKAQKLLPELQHRLSPLGGRLSALRLPGTDTMESVNRQIADLLLSDASEAPQAFGGEQSALHDELLWAGKLKRAFDDGLEATLRHLRDFERDVGDLPATGIPGELRAAIADDLALVADRLGQRTFFEYADDISSRLTAMEAQVAAAVHRLGQLQEDLVVSADADLARLPEWAQLTTEEQRDSLAQLRNMVPAVDATIGGLKKLLAGQYDLTTTIDQLKKKVAAEGRQRLAPPSAQIVRGQETPEKTRRRITVPAKVSSAEDLDILIERLRALRIDAPYCDFDFVIGEG